MPAQTPQTRPAAPRAPASPSEGPNPMVRKKLYFDDVFADILLVHTLNHATFKGAEIGECLAAASKVVEGNAESWQRAWQEQGKKAERAGREADDRGHGVSAREAYLRAVTYYYHACLAIPVDDPAYRAGVEHYRSLFQRFAALSTPAIEVTGIPYQGTRLPAYFLRPDAGGGAHPTVVIGDNTSEELYYWVGPPGVERGYNVLLVDLPGMGLNTFHGVYFRPDTEVAVGACIDYPSERGDVDPSRIAFYGGGEPGGWVAVRAAAREPRIAACVADPYVADSDAILSVFRRPDVAALSNGRQTVPGQAEQTARFYEGEPGAATRGWWRSRRGSGARCSASTIPATMGSCAGRPRPPSRRHRIRPAGIGSSRPRTAPSSTGSSTTSVSSTGSCSTGWTTCSANADQTRCAGSENGVPA